MTLFEKNFGIVTNLYYSQFYRKYTTVSEMATTLLGIEKIDLPLMVNSLEMTPDKKYALVLLGPSCCGKSTYAEKLIKELSAFEVLSMDYCAYEEITQNPDPAKLLNMLNNEVGFPTFGKRLEEGKNLIVDGGWLYINIRCTLLRTLRELGYTICALSFLERMTNEEERLERMKNRVLQYMAQESMGVILGGLSTHDFVSDFAEKTNRTREQVERKFKRSPAYEKKLQTEIIRNQEEILSSAIQQQIENYFIYLGFDYYMEV